MKSCFASSVRRAGTLLLVLSLGLLLVSCEEDDCVTGCNQCSPQKLRTSPDHLLSFLADAYEAEDVDAYGEALSDYFEFEFTPDIADSLGLPQDCPYWGKEEDIASTLKMFDDPDVANVEIHLAPWGVASTWEYCRREFIIGDPPETTLINGL
jgi:hypothetical protein